ncbi:uncharacterized protein METZ01_LOCUS155868 [marine metagenome]|uniref:Uncharacterized protein n=1 Tax=marine metagenome TaxID=408172 RepID=A0A382ANR1_9ZZZZ
MKKTKFQGCDKFVEFTVSGADISK